MGQVIDYLGIVLVTGMAMFAVLGAFAAGWVSGYSQCEDEHRWHRWLLRREENRRTRL